MRIYTLIVLIGLFLFSCCKDEEGNGFIVFESGSEEFGFTTGIANGKHWRASANYVIPERNNPNDNLYLFINTFNNEGFTREVVRIILRNKMPNGQSTLYDKKYRPDGIDNLISYSYSIDGGDVSGALYRLDSDYNNFIEISSFNEETGQLIGNYSYSMLLDVNFSGGNFQERVTVENGYFEAVQKFL